MAIITIIDESGIIFSDGLTISCCHSPDCCEYNYADFEQLDDIARNTEFDTDNMVFKDECLKQFTQIINLIKSFYIFNKFNI